MWVTFFLPGKTPLGELERHMQEETGSVKKRKCFQRITPTDTQMGCFSIPLVTSHASIWERAYWKHLESGSFKKKKKKWKLTGQTICPQKSPFQQSSWQGMFFGFFFPNISRGKLFPNGSFACVHQSVSWRVKYFGEFPLRHFYFREHRRQRHDPKHLNSESYAGRAKAFFWLAVRAAEL